VFLGTEQGSAHQSRESLRIFLSSLASLLFPSTVTLSRADNHDATLRSDLISSDRNARLPSARGWLTNPKSSKRRSRRNGAVPRANNRFARSAFHRVASPTLRERLLLSTRPCVSRTPAFVVVVIVSSRVMGRFQARRGGGPALEAALKGSLGKRRHVGAHLRSRRAASRDVTIAGEQ